MARKREHAAGRRGVVVIATYLLRAQDVNEHVFDALCAARVPAAHSVR